MDRKLPQAGRSLRNQEKRLDLHLGGKIAVLAPVREIGWAITEHFHSCSAPDTAARTGSAPLRVNYPHFVPRANDARWG
jgi:hypothetical protein